MASLDSTLPMIVLEGGTDAGSMLIFDPAALPDDYDEGVRTDPLSAIEPLAAAGTLYWLDTSADGAYSLGVCSGPRLPDELVAFAVRLGESKCFAAPSGRLFFTGIEYAFRHDDAFLRKHPHMGASQAIPAGLYHLTLYEMRYPESFHEDRLREQVSPIALRLYSILNGCLIPLGYVGLLVLVATVFWLGARRWGEWAFVFCLALVLLPLVLSRTPLYRRAKELSSLVERQYPDYIAAFEPTGEGDRL